MEAASVQCKRVDFPVFDLAGSIRADLDVEH